MINLFSIIKYESLMLFRTWKFWILVIIGAFIPIFFNVIFIIVQKLGVDAGWAGLEGAGPYVLFYYYNIFQVAIVIFLTGDFREKDVKMKVVEVMNSRSMTNFEYIFGKFIGIIVPMITLTAVIIITLSLVNYFVNDLWSLGYYVTYFLVLNIPALFFITALCIFVSALLRNSFVVFIVIISYTVGTVIISYYTAYSMNQMWLYVDYVGFYLPLFPSDLVGVLNMNQIIFQRIFYLCLGGMFFGLTVVLFYPRLHQSNFWANMTSFGSLGCVAVAGLILYNAWDVEVERLELQQAILSESLDETPGSPFRITEYSMHYELFKNGMPIKARAEVTVTKEENSTKNTLLFVLNPGLKIIRINDGSGRKLDYIQKNIEILVTPADNINFLESEIIILEYEGDIDSRVVYLNRKANDPGELNKQNDSGFIPNAVFVNETVLLNREYSYLIPESFWYPQLINPYMYHFPDKKPVKFFTGEWSFEVPGDLTAIASG
ncbi:ABC transporter permease, partial [candidate division KSB1 bacterium]|nr:ABC transporter permease [candidate division KSB1 bacterium]